MTDPTTNALLARIKELEEKLDFIQDKCFDLLMFHDHKSINITDKIHEIRDMSIHK